MRDEINRIPINNEGKSAYREVVRSFDNDDPRYIRENAANEVTESVRVSETFDAAPSGRTEPATAGYEVGEVDLSSLTSSSSAASVSTATSVSSAASVTSSVGSVASSIGSSIGALTSVIGTTVAAAVVVVAVFISTLAINLSLVMSDMYSLVFEVEMQGAQEEDFADPDNAILAILTAEDGTYREQEVKQDTRYLTFDDLEPGREYTITVKNAEKTFVTKSYITPSESAAKGSITARAEGNVVSVLVDQVDLRRGEYYTLTAKDAQGNVVYSKDGVESRGASHAGEIDDKATMANLLHFTSVKVL